jgi:hypothetical protein
VTGIRETAEVPAELIDLAMTGAAPGCREDAAFYLANVLAAVRAAERAMVADEIEADFRENVNDAGINIDADRIISARAWGMYRAARIARGRRP